MVREEKLHSATGWRPRVIQSRMYDSTRWNSVKLRDDDIIVATWGKTGTTLTQQIVFQLISRGAEGVGHNASPWVDSRAAGPVREMAAMLDAQTHRRFMKTHLPVDAVPFRPTINYICICRDARDVIWSLYNHVKSFTRAFYRYLNSVEGPWPRREPVDMDVRTFYLNWLTRGDIEGLDMPPFWSHVQGWWDQRHLPNVLLLHYSNLIADLPSEMRRIAQFLQIAIDEAVFPQQVAHCGIDYMREESRKTLAYLSVGFENGADSFFNKGTNGRWRDVLSEEEIARCDEVAAANLTPDCAHWLKTGDLGN